MRRDRHEVGADARTGVVEARLLELFEPLEYPAAARLDAPDGPGPADFIGPVDVLGPVGGLGPVDVVGPVDALGPVERWSGAARGGAQRANAGRLLTALSSLVRRLAADHGTSTVGAPERVRTRWRLDPGHRGAAAVVLLVVLTAAMIGWRVLADAPQSRAAAAAPRVATVAMTAPVAGAPAGTGSAGRPSAGSSAGRPGTTATSGGPLVIVDVVGTVLHPGLVRLTAGSRVDDAVRAAGGALRGTDLSSLNLARLLVDGEQIRVGLPAAPAPGPSIPGGTGGTTGTGGAVGGGPLNLNTATAAELDALPGVGPVLAQRIVDWRTAHGQFDSVDQLNQVSGIGDAKFADLKKLVTLP